MAYSDYGAYIWKNGEDITKKCADKAYYLINNKWIESDNFEPEDSEKYTVAEGHAVLNFNDFCIGFYKVFSPIIYLNNGEIIRTECLEEIEYSNKDLDLEITGYSLGNFDNINFFNIKYKNNIYCVICGSSFGNGFDDYKTSKYIKKNIYFDPDREYHCVYIKNDVDIDIVISKLQRLDDIKFEKYLMKEYGIKPFFKDLFKFQFKNAIFHFNEILERKEIIKWLK